MIRYAGGGCFERMWNDATAVVANFATTELLVTKIFVPEGERTQRDFHCPNINLRHFQ